MGPRCLTCTELWPNPAIHESCADAAVFEESFGDLHNGPRIPLEEMPPFDVFEVFGMTVAVDPSLPENVVEVRGETTVRIELPPIPEWLAFPDRYGYRPPLGEPRGFA